MTNLTLAGIGLDEWEATFVKTTVAVSSGIHIGQWSFVNDPALADAILINTDSGDGEAAARQYDSHGDDNSPLVVACGSWKPDQSTGSSRSLARPVTHKELITVLQALQIDLRTSRKSPDPRTRDREPKPVTGIRTEVPPVLKTPAIRPSVKALRRNVAVAGPPDMATNARSGNGSGRQTVTEPVPGTTEARQNLNKDPQETIRYKARPAKRFFEETRLLGLIRRAAGRDSPTEISHPDFAPILVYPGLDLFDAADAREPEPAMFRTLATEFSIRELGEAETAETVPGRRAEPLWQLLFVACLYGSEGRLLAWCNPHDRFRLEAEPDFSRLPCLDEHRAIVEFMKTENADLTSIAVETGVDVETVIDFCNACEVAGFIERSLLPDARAARRAKMESTAGTSINRFRASVMNGLNDWMHRVSGRA